MHRNYFKLIIKLIKKYFDDDILAFSSQLAYNFLLSCFPFLIFIVTLINNMGLQSDLFYHALKKILPNNAYTLVYNTLETVVYEKHTTLMSITIVLTIWTASIGFSGVIKGINRAYDVKENRSFWRLQVINITYTLIFAFSIIFTMIVLIYGSIENKAIIRRTGYDAFFSVLWRIIEYGILGLFLVAIFACLYRYAPCIRLPWKNVLPGAIFTVATWLGSSVGFSYYANNYAKYADLYGGIAAIIVLMTWFFVASNIILIGGEINGALYSDIYTVCKVSEISTLEKRK